jgi:hypothetical protein
MQLPRPEEAMLDLHGSMHRGDVTVSTPTFSVEVITLPVSDVERAPRVETMPASPTSPIRMETSGCYRNEATATCDIV